jgi:hypothetical protein
MLPTLTANHPDAGGITQTIGAFQQYAARLQGRVSLKAKAARTVAAMHAIEGLPDWFQLAKPAYIACCSLGFRVRV